MACHSARAVFLTVTKAATRSSSKIHGLSMAQIGYSPCNPVHGLVWTYEIGSA